MIALYLFFQSFSLKTQNNEKSDDMHGVQGRILLKQKILQILISEEDYLTSQQIQKKLGYSNVETIQELCHEMNEEYKEATMLKDNLLTISVGEGCKFTGNLKYISKYNEYMLIQDLTYKILIHSFFKKTSINAMLHLCAISYSTLRRRVIDVNEYLSKINLKVNMKDHLSLEGEEYTKRIFLFLFMYYVHIDIKNVSVIVNQQKYLDLAKKINEDLNLNIQYHKIEGFAIWMYIMEYSINSKHLISFPNSIDKGMRQDAIYPKKPNYLKHWPDDEWKFFCMIASINGIFNTENIIDLSDFTKELMNKNGLWIDLFEHYFRPLNHNEKKYVALKSTQIYLLTTFINLEENMVDRFFSVKYDKIKKHDSFTKTFETMWEHYIRIPNVYHHSFYKTNSYLLCKNMFHQNAFRTLVKIFLYAKGGPIYTHYLQETIRTRFSSEYEIVFVQTDYLADIVVATVPYECDEKIDTTYISSEISKYDYLRILYALEDIKEKKESSNVL